MADSEAAVLPLADQDAPLARGPWGDGWRRFARNRAALLGLAIIVTFSVLALLAPWVDRGGPTVQHLDAPLQGPSARFWLGTDQLGRDQYSRLVHGARVSLAVGFFTQVVAVTLGVAVGLAAGLGGRKTDALMMRSTDIAYAFPDLLMMILLVSIFGASVPMLILALGLVTWTTIARLVRAQVLSLREEEFVLAARALGADGWRVARHHLLPNLMGPVIVAATFMIPAAIFAEAALAFIGLGLPPPAPSWGRLATDSFSTLAVAPHLALTSCLAIALTMMSFSFIGDGLRDALDPRSTARTTLADAQATARSSTRTMESPEERKAA